MVNSIRAKAGSIALQTLWGALALVSTLLSPIHAAPLAPAGAPASLAYPAPVDEYQINQDGGIVYNPLSREAAKTGQIKAYRNVPRVSRTVSLDNCHVELQIPKTFVPYDVVPIPYTLSWNEGASFPLGVETTAFEDPKQCTTQNLYDLTIPHRIDLSTSYVGSVTANVDPAQKHDLTSDFSDTPKTYPGFAPAAMVRSGTVASGDLVWFKFHLVNTGDTILGSEGFGGSLLYPELLRKDSSGNYVHFAYPMNLYYRNIHYWYPGESWDPWITFLVPPAAGNPPESYHLPPGEYVIRIRLAYRSYKDTNPAVDYWDGPIAYTYDQPITVEPTARQAPVIDGQKQPSAGDYPDKLPTFIHTFEQFMTSFDLQLQPPTTGERTIHGVLNLQVAPWTHDVVVKLIGTGGRISTVAVPIVVDDESPKLTIKPDMSNTVIGKDGRRWPIFETQTMSDMRANVHMGPHPEQYIAADLQNMKQLGVNVLCSTSGGWDLQDRGKPVSDFAGDAGKYALDVARRKGLEIDAWGLYTCNQFPAVEQEAEWYTGRDFSGMATTASGYSPGGTDISYVEPRLGEAYSAIALYNFHRWGDLFFQNSNGDVPIDIEDTRGWMRDDVNAHFPVGALGDTEFRQWVQAKYQTIELANKAWGTNFASFDAIDPESHVADGAFMWAYTNQSFAFHEWNRPLEDYDEWRTKVRLDYYRNILTNVRKEIPNAQIELRTEGANVIAAGLDPESPNAHIRHAYYSQRRCAIVAEPIVASGLIKYHSDYTTLPYTPSELRYLVRLSVKQGIVPTYLPTFNDMRDIAINDRYGNDYQHSYNLSTPAKGYMMHVLTASYLWYKIMDEEGGVPGILWEDYECDGYVTETQAKEMQFFQQKLKQALAHTVKSKQTTPSKAWKTRSRSLYSYILPASLH